MSQLPLELPLTENVLALEGGCRERLSTLLAWDLDFHDRVSGYASHNFHPFPAKFPPQLPRLFITGLTQPGERVLDPMVGSGTTVVEALLAGRWGIGVDLDPLALLLCRVKTTPLALDEVERTGIEVWRRASRAVEKGRRDLEEELRHSFDSRTRDFIEYWFLPEAQVELMALAQEIDQVKSPPVRSFLWLVFSAIVIAKSGGVSLARDLAHTRPHRDLSKPFRSPLAEFKKRLRQNLRGLVEIVQKEQQASVIGGDAQRLPLTENSVDLIVTSPPYAANAIDYMRAHKFSLVWMGYPISALSEKRREYIGGEAIAHVSFEPMPADVMQVVADVAERDARKARVLHRYYSEMRRCLSEMYRVLRPGRAAIVVVGTSSMRGVDTRTQDCLARIGEEVGFEVAGIAVRRLDRDRRMMPARRGRTPASQIEQRMHEEYVIGFYKPEA
jgi:DNA modification methylase